MKIKEILENKIVEKLDQEILLASVLKKDRSFLSAFPSYELSMSEEEVFNNFLDRRIKQEPIAYILGYQEFYGLKFAVNKSVLIPRPETENLVEKVLDFSAGKHLTLVDVGTGSGAIAISLALKNPQFTVFATDISKNALEIAKKNSQLLKVDNRITFLESDLLENLPDKIDLIVANLPYIPTSNWEKLPKSIKDFEPRLALDSQLHKTSVYEKLFTQAKKVLNKNGVIFYEIDGDVFFLTQKELIQSY